MQKRGFFLPAASCRPHLPEPAVPSGPSGASDPSGAGEGARSAGEAPGAAAALRRQESAGHGEAEPAMCRKQRCWEGGGSSIPSSPGRNAAAAP